MNLICKRGVFQTHCENTTLKSVNPTSESLFYMVHSIHLFFCDKFCLHLTPLPYPFLLLSCLFFLSSLVPTLGFFSCGSYDQVVFTAVCSRMQWSCLIQESLFSSNSQILVGRRECLRR